MTSLPAFLKRKDNNKEGLPPELLAQSVAQRILVRLEALGFCHRTKTGPTQTIRLAGPVGLTKEKRLAILSLDLQRLPQGVKALDLESPKTLRELSLVAGRPVKATHKQGLFFYVVDLYPEKRERLPRKAALNLSQRPNGPFTIPLGISPNGPLWGNLVDHYHVLLGGPTGSGKSNALHCFMASLLAQHGPDELHLYVIDAKGGIEFAEYAAAPHLKAPIAESVADARTIFRRLEAEVRLRGDLLKSKGVRGWADYNSLVTQENRLPLIVVVVDEFLVLTVESGGSTLSTPFSGDLARLVTTSRALGIQWLLSCCYPKSTVMDTAIRHACSLRYAFGATTRREASVILGDLPEGVSLPDRMVPGRALLRVNQSFYQVQTYEAPAATIVDIVRGAGGTRPLLSRKELALAELALDKLNGDFTINALYNLMGSLSEPCMEGGISHRQLTKLGQAWEYRGWLTSPPDPTIPRQITPQLKQIVADTRSRYEPVTIAERHRQAWAEQQAATP